MEIGCCYYVKALARAGAGVILIINGYITDLASFIPCETFQSYFIVFFKLNLVGAQTIQAFDATLTHIYVYTADLMQL